MAKGQVEGGKALQAARAAEIDAASHRPTAAQKQQQIAELEERAVLFGDPVKQSAQAKVLERKWQRFLLVHYVQGGPRFVQTLSRHPLENVASLFTFFCPLDTQCTCVPGTSIV